MIPSSAPGRWLTACLALGTVTACASLQHDEPPAIAVDVRAGWQAAPATPLPAPSAASAAWWKEFQDPALDRFLTDVLERNLDLAAAAARLERALAAARATGAALAPQVSLSADGARRKQVFVGLPIPGAEGRALANTSSSVGAALNVSWEVDAWGRLRADRAASRSLAGAAAADLDALRLSLTAQSVKAWFAALEARQQLALARDVLATREIAARQVRARYLRGLRPALDLRLARAEEAAAASAVAAREQAVASTSRQLRLLAARYPEPAPPTDAILPSLPPPPALGVPADLVSRRPDVAAAERRVEAAGFSVTAARAALLPGLRVTGSTGRLGQELADLLESDFSVWSLAVGILQPVFQGGRLRAALEASRAEAEELALVYAQTLLHAFSEVEEALAAENLLGRQSDALARALVDAEGASRLAGSRYRSGLADYLTVLDAERRFAETRSRLVELERQRLSNRVDLYLALGGGWPREGEGFARAGAAPTNQE